MPEVAVYAPGTVSWVDLASKDLEKSKAFYSKLFGWQAQTIEDPQAGGYTMFLINGKQASALGPISRRAAAALGLVDLLRHRGREEDRRKRSRTPAAR